MLILLTLFMREITVHKWNETTPAGTVAKLSTTSIIGILLDTAAKTEKLIGFSWAQKYQAIVKAANDAEKSGIMILEETEYKTVITYVDKYTPAAWGRSPDAMYALELIKDAEKVNTQPKPKAKPKTK